MKFSVPILFGLSLSTTFSQEPDELIELSPFEVAASPSALRPDTLPLSGTVVPADFLFERNGASIGSILDGEPGVSTGNFAPGASRPIIRGQDAERVRILEGGMESFDLSASSPDHAPALDPLLAGSVSILRGPATLIYGGSSIGGMVSSDMAEIPLDEGGHVPRNLIGMRGSSGSRGGAVAGRATTGVNGSKLRLQGSMRDEGDYIVPERYTLPDEHEAETEHADENIRRLPGTFVRSRYGSAGWAHTTEKVELGVSSSIFTSEYGVPFHLHGHEEHDHDHDDVPHEEEHAVTVKLERTRHAAEAHLTDPAPFIKVLSLKAVAGDYWHEERDGEMVATRFERSGYEARIDALHPNFRGIEGAWGISYLNSSFSANGSEAFAPASDTSSAAIFIVEEWRRNSLWIQAGVRLERNDIQVDSDAPNYADTATSASLSVVSDLGRSWAIGLSGVLASRHPSATELYANGPHASTGRFELGNPDLKVERAESLELSLSKTSGHITGRVQLFVSNYADYILLRDTDSSLHGLKLAHFEATDARFHGGEAFFTMKLWGDETLAIQLTNGGDYVVARERSANRPLPRIPPARLWSTLELQAAQQWRIAISVRHSFRQNDVAPDEEVTGAYTTMNLEGSMEIAAGDSSIRIFAGIHNIFDTLGYHHTSFIKDYSPIAGRHIHGGIRVTF